MKKIFFALIAFPVAMFFSTCEKTNDPDPLTMAEFVGSYTLDTNSYKVPLDSLGNEIVTERISLEDETISVIIGNMDTIIFESPSMGRIKGKGTIDGQIIRIPIDNQPFNGNDLDPTGPNTIESPSPILLEKNDGKRRITGECLVNKPMAKSRRYYSTGFK